MALNVVSAHEQPVEGADERETGKHAARGTIARAALRTRRL